MPTHSRPVRLVVEETEEEKMSGPPRIDEPHPMYEYFGEEPPAFPDIQTEQPGPVALVREMERLEKLHEETRAKLIERLGK